MNNFLILNCAKAPGLRDCKRGRIEVILPPLAIPQPRGLSRSLRLRSYLFTNPKRLFFLVFFALSLHASEACFFIPPKDWEIANPEILSQRVHICFLGKTAKGLRPSINLATEPVDVSLDAYINEVRKIHTSDPNSRWRDLGKFKSLLGEGRLTELETPTEFGMARMVQLVVIKDRIAYILTASSIKEEFSKYYKTFDLALKSLQSSTDLIGGYPVKSGELRTLIANLNQKYQQLGSEQFQKEIWPSFEKKLINDFTEMGPYWQIILLKQTQEKLLTLRVE